MRNLDRFSKLLLIVFTLLVPALATPLVTVDTDPDGDGPFAAGERVRGRIVVDFKGEFSDSELALWGRLYDVEPRSVLPSHGLATISVDEKDMAQTLDKLSHDPLIQTVSPDYVAHAHGIQSPESRFAAQDPTASFPNDPRFKEQWHLKMIGAQKAWKKSNGEGVIVAVIDTGIAYAEKGRTRPVEDLAQTKIVAGYDFVNKDALAVDDAGYGTHLAGTVAQSTNNRVGVAGMAYQATLMPVKVLDEKGSGTFSGIAAGIRFAADNGAHILLLGLGSPNDSLVMEEAVEYAHEKGCLLIGSVGVTGGETPGFPAEYEQVVGVGAVDISRKVTNYSNKGADIAAPGGYATELEGILQNTIHAGNPRRSGYLWQAGTNCSAAHVAGVAALVMSTGVKDPDKVREILMTTTRKMRDKRSYGAGIVMANKAVDKARKSKSEKTHTGFILVLLALALGLYRRK